jgi:hypothetical protein
MEVHQARRGRLVVWNYDSRFQRRNAKRIFKALVTKLRTDLSSLPVILCHSMKKGVMMSFLTEGELGLRKPADSISIVVTQQNADF